MIVIVYTAQLNGIAPKAGPVPVSQMVACDRIGREEPALLARVDGSRSRWWRALSLLHVAGTSRRVLPRRRQIRRAR